MIDRKDVLAFSYYKLAPFTGSDGNMRYRIEKAVEGEETYLKTTIWPGPYCYTATDPELFIIYKSEFSEEGIVDAVNWMNSKSDIYNTKNPQ